MADRRSTRSLTLIVSIAAALVVACEGWGEAWEALFTRTDLGDAAQGWTGGDVAVSAPLPGGRVVYLFGDSFVTSMPEDGTRPELRGDGWGASRTPSSAIPSPYRAAWSRRARP